MKTYGEREEELPGEANGCQDKLTYVTHNMAAVEYARGGKCWFWQWERVG